MKKSTVNIVTDVSTLSNDVKTRVTTALIEESVIAVATESINSPSIVDIKDGYNPELEPDLIDPN